MQKSACIAEIGLSTKVTSGYTFYVHSLLIDIIVIDLQTSVTLNGISAIALRPC